MIRGHPKAGRALAASRAMTMSQKTWRHSAALAAISTLALVMSGCRSGSESPIVSSGHEFSELFQLVETVRLDSSVLIGELTYVDVSLGGDFLVSDYSAGKVMVFDRSGKVRMVLDADSCAPGLDFRPRQALYFRDREMLVTSGTQSFLFDGDGTCNGRVEQLEPAPQSICVGPDAIFTYTTLRESPSLSKYSLALSRDGDLSLVRPHLPVLTRIFQGFTGRQIACLGLGVYYLYPGDSDGRLAGASGSTAVHRPHYYYPPSRDRKLGDTGSLIADGRELWNESTLAIAIYALNDRTRLVAFANSPRRVDGGGTRAYGLNIVNDLVPNSAGQSVFTTGIPLLAKNDRLYLLAQGTPNGRERFANPAIEVYRYLN